MTTQYTYTKIDYFLQLPEDIQYILKKYSGPYQKGDPYKMDSLSTFWGTSKLPTIPDVMWISSTQTPKFEYVAIKIGNDISYYSRTKKTPVSGGKRSKKSRKAKKSRKSRKTRRN